ncbi:MULTISPECIES: hypothetical protein [Burkholderia]|uniref:Uncharacterized protein n=1 Tax=Burkholderia pseudomultivorans TaxID=1207504 RepID=A0ABU2ED60_9BURK|nr:MULTISPECIES: hypothetical protein [Burkholderia]MDR8731452.1 hypothetical protein [Burkholderia pseudomultivorans]MDR8738783.1 hypothetical protein [Burkholderia pseudomultivorans]MDR8745384.1 hypothetical protein [Burkholderia pseudomultivorans]MDR8757523.1 hypothetical protein [Burkholderia pseudomultivorans]MDR8781629.1 hypothetical protein [Burkholderia pseudomultivorans]
MSYRSPFIPIVYPDETGRPSAMQYRIVFTEREPWLAILQLRQTGDDYASPVESPSVRDHVLNRLLDSDLRALPLGVLRLVAGDASGEFEYEMTPDIHDYIGRGNRYRASPERARRGKLVERIEIDSRSLVAGSVRVDTVHAVAAPLSAEVRAAPG